MIKYFIAPIVNDEGMWKWWLPIDKPPTLTISSQDIYPNDLTCVIKVEGPISDINKLKDDALLEVEE